MLTWIMFLKFLDDLEQVRKDEAAMEDRELLNHDRSALQVARSKYA